MIEGFQKFILEKQLFHRGEKIILAVSGGIDSVVMAELFSASGFDFAIAHCNFKLRGDESDRDELFVRELAKEKKVKCFVKEFNTEEYAEKNKLSIQMAARQLRYDWFESLIGQEGFLYYASAHHHDDQIETFFINLFRGTGISGLHGIKPKQGKLIRPLLFAQRIEIEGFAAKNGIAFREDSSNQKNDYLRNDIRHNLIPVLQKIKPDFADVMEQNISRFSQAEDIYRNEIKTQKKRIVRIEDKEVKIDIEKLKLLYPLETYLYEFLVPYGFSFANTHDIIDSLYSEPGRKFLSNSYVLIRDREYLIIRKEKSGIEDSNKEYKIKLLDKIISEPLKLKLDKFERTSDFTFIKDKKTASLDFGKLTFPLTLRKWKKGDYFSPLGMTNKKLLSDFFTDNKFSLFEKEDTWLLLSDDKIVWVIGHRIDNRFKIDKSTKNIFQIAYSA
jgi:tRNA(Ile)-lysidine synthase